MNINKCYDLPYPVEQVYLAWVSSSTVIAPATAMDLKPEIGGHYQLTIVSEDFSRVNHGCFLAVEPNRHLRYTWEWNFDGEITEIDLTFTQTAQGTRVDLTHTGFLKQQSVDRHNSGWDSYIQGFCRHLASQ
jgi:uncharacterized protein YndB with AHSA1/START domain